MIITKTHKLLAALLGAQVLLAAGLLVAQRWPGAASDNAPLLAFAQDQVDRITLEGADKAKAVLVKKDSRWTVAQAGDFPAAAAQVTQLLGRLATLKAGAPVATSADAQERFKVADTSFERRISLDAAGKTLATLYLGSPQGARLSHARRGGDSNIVTLEFAAHDVPARDDDWLDKALLQVPRADIEAIEIGTLKLAKQEAVGSPGTAPAASAASAAAAAAPGWVATGLAAGESLDPSAADRLAGVLADLRFTGLAAGADAQRFSKPELALTLVRKGGARVDYQLTKVDGKDDYLLKVSTRAEVFTLPAFAARPLLDAARRSALAQQGGGAAAK